jgi:hypothetical protein
MEGIGMTNWITDREPTIKDGDPFGNVLAVGYGGDVIVERFDQVNKGIPWLPTPVTPKQPSTRWQIGMHPNIITDGNIIIVVSGGDGKRQRDEVVSTIVQSLNDELE